MMKKLLSFNRAVWILGLLFALLMLFHVTVILGLVPGEIVWGGRVNSRAELLQMELVSMVMLVVSLGILWLKKRQVERRRKNLFISALPWLLVLLFSLNTLGNLVAETMTETLIFTPLTVIMALLSLRVALERSSRGDEA